MIKTIEYIDDIVRMIDQTRLPGETTFVDCKTIEDVGDAIKTMIIRGAPAIGVAAAMGVSLEAQAIQANDFETFYSQLEKKCAVLAQSRPTAVNLAWGIERMKSVARDNKNLPLPQLRERLKQEALDICKQDIASNMAMGEFGQTLIEAQNTVLTHCNAGALATAGFGTALGVIRAAMNAGKNIKVIANETRPFLQGARLTAWELKEDKIPVKLITDNMCGHLMKSGQIDRVVVGADRIAANGDVANKIGTYMVAVMAHRHNIPFYVAAPISTLDLSLPSGDDIPIEERSANEVVTINNKRIAPENIEVGHPAFDVTPNDLISAIITDRGIAYPPYIESLKALAELKQ
ncbi:MAG: S-methyl-5-thioribose-1-phosphate isomerase [Candidatus Nitrohelix vancouverensis]|uniref:Methylthioribose-1-phosphate isomerase n=1 Tax=Candidatus Nitrohelix vancouverensis TaxID=2705534 RepID=A0A7T0C4M8_9BACT|nr:MAG: S-methyl-5-thioribose-1-phosphate isomerase [Candidatus Nitrohelix vancouverensis]